MPTEQRYFPQGIAVRGSFCNRDDERALLKKSISVGEHTVLVAPRRYGKTSLIAQVLEDSDLPSASIDFFFVLEQSEVVKLLADGIARILGGLLPKAKAAKTKFINSVLSHNPKITISLLGQKVELGINQSNEKSISELLLMLDQLAKKSKKHCVIVFDEFQQIGELKENHAVEAAIRHAVERSQYISYVFCGSKRHLLNEMFSDKNRPLYHLCDLMAIDRIAASSYKHFLNQQAIKRWKKSLSGDVNSEIIQLTEAHPYYVNALCRKLWHLDSPPSLVHVKKGWDEYVKTQSAWILNDISRLTLNRRKVLVALAHQSTSIPQGQAFSKRTGLNPSGIKKALLDLELADMAYKDEEQNYRVLDPAVGYYIRM